MTKRPGGAELFDRAKRRKAIKAADDLYDVCCQTQLNLEARADKLRQEWEVAKQSAGDASRHVDALQRVDRFWNKAESFICQGVCHRGGGCQGHARFSICFQHPDLQKCKATCGEDLTTVSQCPGCIASPLSANATVLTRLDTGQVLYDRQKAEGTGGYWTQAALGRDERGRYYFRAISTCASCHEKLTGMADEWTRFVTGTRDFLTIHLLPPLANLVHEYTYTNRPCCWQCKRSDSLMFYNLIINDVV